MSSYVEGLQEWLDEHKGQVMQRPAGRVRYQPIGLIDIPRGVTRDGKGLSTWVLFINLTRLRFEVMNLTQIRGLMEVSKIR